MLPESLSKAKRQENSVLFETKSGRSFSLPTAFLRAGSPSAENTNYDSGYLQEDRLKKATAKYEKIELTQMERVGNYALRLSFSDGHKTGIYSFRHLFELEALYQRIHLCPNDEPKASAAKAGISSQRI